MINRISNVSFAQSNIQLRTKKAQTQNNVSDSINCKGTKTHSADAIALAFQGYNGIKTASSIPFKGSLSESFDKLRLSMKTCNDPLKKGSGEDVGSRVDVNELLAEMIQDLPKYDDAIKTNLEVKSEKGENNKVTSLTEARSQVKRKDGSNCVFEMVVRPPRYATEKSHHTNFVQQVLRFEVGPGYGENFKTMPEQAYVLNTKGNLMAVVEDNDNVLLTNAGLIRKRNTAKGKLDIQATQYELKDDNGNKLSYDKLLELNTVQAIKNGDDKKGINANMNYFHDFKVDNVPAVTKKSGGSQGGGTELVIGLEPGRFVPEIIDSIATFVDKVNNDEIVLDEFKPADNAQNIQIAMLAGGYGSRAEYTNASSSKIFHGEADGSNLTKGCFRTATGLTPMETTFISLHKAGLLDCSKGNLGIGKNIKFYLNDSGTNRGNGGFTTDLYDTMKRSGRESLLILPNDAMSRIPEALSELTGIQNSGNAAMVMVAKATNKEVARGSLGIMKIAEDKTIDAFAEKPKVFQAGYVDENDNCFANTFQFSVSKEAFEALELLEPYLPPKELGKESRDWSKVLTPVIMGITQNDDPKKMQKQIRNSFSQVKEFKEAGIQNIPLDKLQEAKNILGNQKVYAVKTEEPWADCGTLNALYDTTMKIAHGEFKLEDFERKHVLDCVNTDTGLIASSPEQKDEIEEKYEIRGQVMVVPKAHPVPQNLPGLYASAITKYSDIAD